MLLALLAIGLGLAFLFAVLRNVRLQDRMPPVLPGSWWRGNWTQLRDTDHFQLFAKSFAYRPGSATTMTIGPVWMPLHRMVVIHDHALVREIFTQHPSALAASAQVVKGGRPIDG